MPVDHRRRFGHCRTGAGWCIFHRRRAHHRAIRPVGSCEHRRNSASLLPVRQLSNNNVFVGFGVFLLFIAVWYSTTFHVQMHYNIQ